MPRILLTVAIAALPFLAHARTHPREAWPGMGFIWPGEAHEQWHCVKRKCGWVIIRR